MKTFNTTGVCVPERHYMVDLSSRLEKLVAMVDHGDYFTINRGRQYGKTTLLAALERALKNRFTVVSLDFQGISTGDFVSETTFVWAFCRMIKREIWNGLTLPPGIEDRFDRSIGNPQVSFSTLFDVILEWCYKTPQRIVLFIDEVDSATNNQVFLDFLAQLRDGYIRRDTKGAPAFQSVILAGVTDVRNLRRKLRPEEAHRYNSPWNIAADFNVDMSFNAMDIAGMLGQYEADHHTDMDIPAVARMIEDYTSGYPFLVSRICQLLDADGGLGWDERGVGEIVRRIVSGRNLLFDSLMGKVCDNDRLRETLRRVLIAGEAVSYNAYDPGIADAEMYGFIVSRGGRVKVSNRIFEVVLYNYFISQEELDSPTFRAGSGDRNAFVRGGRLDMEYVLERYVSVHEELYRHEPRTFDEAEGRLRFLLFVRPIINGTGNYYIETQTLDGRRMDVVIDYLGERFVIELKIWRGDQYNRRGEDQLLGYLDAFGLKKGYMLSYNFNQNRRTGVRHIQLEGRELVEAVV